MRGRVRHLSPHSDRGKKGVIESAQRTVAGTVRLREAGCSAAWLARGVWDAEVAGSNPASPTRTENCAFQDMTVREGRATILCSARV